MAKKTPKSAKDKAAALKLASDDSPEPSHETREEHDEIADLRKRIEVLEQEHADLVEAGPKHLPPAKGGKANKAVKKTKASA
jgi:hypothetical protein